MKATITKTQNAQPLGFYKPTALDVRKVHADILVTACGSKYSIHSKVPLSGNGIRSFNNGNYEVSESVLAKLRRVYNVENDF